MSAVREQDVKAALLAALEARQASGAAGLPMARRGRGLRDRRATEAPLQALTAPWLGQAGSVLEKFEAIRARHEAAMLAAAAAQRDEAAGRASRLSAAFRRDIASRRRALEALVAAAQPSVEPFRVALTRPFLIWCTPSAALLQDSHYEDWNSWAKISLDDRRAWTMQALHFYYLWENPGDFAVVANIDSWLMAHGVCVAMTDGSWWSDNHNSLIDVVAGLSPLEWWNQPPTSPAPQPGQVAQVAYVSAHSSGPLDIGDIQGADVFRTYDLRHELMVIPAGGVAVFDVGLQISTACSSGRVQMDFAFGDFEVLCPFVFVDVVSAPPTA
jgi:hypothetical protein